MLLPLLRKPSPEVLCRYIADQRTKAFSYEEVKHTASHPPAGYVVDHTRVCLGTGQADFDAACSALKEWRQFRLGWLEPAAPPPAIQEGEIVALAARLLGGAPFRRA